MEMRSRVRIAVEGVVYRLNGDRFFLFREPVWGIQKPWPQLIAGARVFVVTVAAPKV